MDRWQGKVAVVTGASAGIGLAVAKSLVKSNMIVIGLARRLEKMQKEMDAVDGPGKFYAHECDVTDEKKVNETFEWIEKEFKTVHILVNNAGTTRKNTFADIPTEDLQLIVNTNIMGVLYCTRAAMKLMKKNNHESHIVMINSNSGHSIPSHTVCLNIYPATKHALTAICQCLIKEIDGAPIRVTSISPGLTATEIFETANLGKNYIQENFKMKIMDAQDVADSVLHAISAPPHVQIWEIMLKPLGQVN